MDPILVENKGAWSLVTLNRPERLNSFDAGMHRALAAALKGLDDDETCRAVMITGAGRGFCAGQDLEALPKDGVGDVIGEFYNPLVRRIRAMAKPVVAAVNGVAAGAGANFALACDIVVAARSAKFIQSFAMIGLVPDSGGTWFLPRLVGDARARALALTGEAVDAEQAAEWGMIWKALDDETMLYEAQSLTAHLSTQPTAALALIKKALDAAAGNSLDRQLDLERDLQKEAASMPDYKEGVRAFLEKRPPHFTGRPA